MALENGGTAPAIKADAKLAAYLLSPATARYEVGELAASYGADPAFACPG